MRLKKKKKSPYFFPIKILIPLLQNHYIDTLIIKKKKKNITAGFSARKVILNEKRLVYTIIYSKYYYKY